MEEKTPLVNLGSVTDGTFIYFGSVDWNQEPPPNLTGFRQEDRDRGRTQEGTKIGRPGLRTEIPMLDGIQVRVCQPFPYTFLLEILQMKRPNNQLPSYSLCCGTPWGDTKDVSALYCSRKDSTCPFGDTSGKDYKGGTKRRNTSDPTSSLKSKSRQWSRRRQ